MPDEMLGMLQQKTVHPEAGANCAWVPSPTAASIHAIHYHQINVADVQNNLLQRQKASLDDILIFLCLRMFHHYHKKIFRMSLIKYTGIWLCC